MKYSEENFDTILAKLNKTWSNRSQYCYKKLGPGCFVYDPEKDIGSSGMFYKYDMLPKYFAEEMAADLQEMIKDDSNQEQIVAAVIFEDRVAGARLRRDFN